MYQLTTGTNYWLMKNRSLLDLQEAIWITGISKPWILPLFFMQEKILLLPRSGMKENGGLKDKYLFAPVLFCRETKVRIKFYLLTVTGNASGIMLIIPYGSTRLLIMLPAPEKR